ncbi:Uncharacterised protein [Mycobacteroides abscessus subsp. abscessus]|nr:Uncharacterised protein [Mycobacteroides abscessus subsp. abscessus]
MNDARPTLEFGQHLKLTGHCGTRTGKEPRAP